MAFLFSVYITLLGAILNLAGLRQHRVEIDPGTIINIWGPSRAKNSSKRSRLNKKIKKSVVLLHGFSANGAFNWQFQALSLTGEYSVYIPDFVFFGDSVTNRADRSPEFQARCVAEALKRLGVDRCALVGTSYGGMVGFKMAEMFPEMIESLVAVCTVMALTESVSSESLRRIGFERWSDLLLPETVEGVAKMFGIGTYGLAGVPKFVCNQILGAIFNNRKEKKELLAALVTPDEDFTLPNFSQNFGLLWGQNDKIFSMETASNLNKQLGDNAIMFESIDKAGHLAQIERPFVFNKHLKKILASLSKDT